MHKETRLKIAESGTIRILGGPDGGRRLAAVY
jgi:hypothetical protein